MDQIMSDVLIKLTGLWERHRRGNAEEQCYLVGRLGAAKLLAFKNRSKQSDNDPDWTLFLTEPSPPRQNDTPRPGRSTWNATSDPPPPDPTTMTAGDHAAYAETMAA